MSVDGGLIEWYRKRGKSVVTGISKEKKQMMEECFELLDADRSGALDAEELYAAFHFLGHRVSAEDCELLVEQWDNNRNGTIDFNEFIHIVGSKKAVGEHSDVSDGEPEGVAPSGTHPEASSAPRTMSTVRRSRRRRASRKPANKDASSDPSGAAHEGGAADSGEGDGKVVPKHVKAPFEVLVRAYRRKRLLNAVLAGDRAAQKIAGRHLKQAPPGSQGDTPIDPNAPARLQFSPLTQRSAVTEPPRPALSDPKVRKEGRSPPRGRRNAVHLGPNALVYRGRLTTPMGSVRSLQSNPSLILGSAASYADDDDEPPEMQLLRHEVDHSVITAESVSQRFSLVLPSLVSERALKIANRTRVMLEERKLGMIIKGKVDPHSRVEETDKAVLSTLAKDTSTQKTSPRKAKPKGAGAASIMKSVQRHVSVANVEGMPDILQEEEELAASRQASQAGQDEASHSEDPDVEASVEPPEQGGGEEAASGGGGMSGMLRLKGAMKQVGPSRYRTEHSRQQQQQQQEEEKEWEKRATSPEGPKLRKSESLRDKRSQLIKYPPMVLNVLRNKKRDESGNYAEGSDSDGAISPIYMYASDGTLVPRRGRHGIDNDEEDEDDKGEDDDGLTKEEREVKRVEAMVNAQYELPALSPTHALSRVMRESARAGLLGPLEPRAGQHMMGIYGTDTRPLKEFVKSPDSTDAANVSTQALNPEDASPTHPAGARRLNNGSQRKTQGGPPARASSLNASADLASLHRKGAANRYPGHPQEGGDAGLRHASAVARSSTSLGFAPTMRSMDSVDLRGMSRARDTLSVPEHASTHGAMTPGTGAGGGAAGYYTFYNPASREYYTVYHPGMNQAPKPLGLGDLPKESRYRHVLSCAAAEKMHASTIEGRGEVQPLPVHEIVKDEVMNRIKAVQVVKEADPHQIAAERELHIRRPKGTTTLSDAAGLPNVNSCVF
eukprot:jgi/Mesvir1/27495/Mv07265-RA.1